jgi:hypothetical protein
VNHLKARGLLLAGIAIAIGPAFAQQPPPSPSGSTPPSATSAPTAAPAAPPAAATAVSGPPPRLLREARRPGYQIKKLPDGTTVMRSNSRRP